MKLVPTQIRFLTDTAAHSCPLALQVRTVAAWSASDSSHELEAARSGVGRPTAGLNCERRSVRAERGSDHHRRHGSRRHASMRRAEPRTAALAS